MLIDITYSVLFNTLYIGEYMTKLKKFALIMLYHEYLAQPGKDFLNHIIDEAKKVDLNIENVIVTSSFGKMDEVKSIVGYSIELTDFYEIIDESDYCLLAQIANSTRPYNRLKITYGYGMRTINNSYSLNVSITAGSHCVITNSISLDIKTYIQLDKEAMAHRLAHELLHEFGYSEEQVLYYQDEYYDYVKLILKPTVDIIWDKLELAELLLESRINDLFSNGSYEEQVLNKMFNELLQNGFYDLTSATMEIIHPISNENKNIFVL